MILPRYFGRTTGTNMLLSLCWLFWSKICRKIKYGSPNDSPQRALQNLLRLKGQTVLEAGYQLVLRQPQVHLLILEHATDALTIFRHNLPPTSHKINQTHTLSQHMVQRANMRRLQTCLHPSVKNIKKIYRNSRVPSCIMHKRLIQPCWHHVAPSQHSKQTQQSKQFKNWNNS